MTIFFFFFFLVLPQSPRVLDSILQTHAFKSMNPPKPRTGILYNATLSGINVSAVRLRSGSFRNRGFHHLNQFHIPIGVIEQPYVQRLILVYQSFDSNSSSLFYPLPGYSFLSPVLGLLAYDASNLSATYLPELDLRASFSPIFINFINLKPTPHSSYSPMCVSFYLDGLVDFSNLLPGNVCSTLQHGHFSIVVQSNAPSPSPAPAVDQGQLTLLGFDGVKARSSVWIILGCSIVGLVVLLNLGLIVVCAKRRRNMDKIRRIDEAVEVGGALLMSRVGNTKAPVAMGTRTRPVLENEYVP